MNGVRLAEENTSQPNVGRRRTVRWQRRLADVSTGSEVYRADWDAHGRVVLVMISRNLLLLCGHGRLTAASSAIC
jgi:hypothetical protein